MTWQFTSDSLKKLEKEKKLDDLKKSIRRRKYIRMYSYGLNMKPNRGYKMTAVDRDWMIIDWQYHKELNLTTILFKKIKEAPKSNQSDR